MNEYIECPYCGEVQEIDNDGYSHDVDTKYRQKCAGCGKNFAYKKTISIYYKAFVAPCINGDAKHDWKETKTLNFFATMPEKNIESRVRLEWATFG